MNVKLAARAWEHYLFWAKTDRKTFNRLIKSIQRNPREGEGKPEELRGNLRGHWSRRITQEHRLVYVIFDDPVEIRSCRFHYAKS